MMLKIKSITFDNHPIFKNKTISFEKNDGQTADNVIIVGENGSGKSELLRILKEISKIKFSKSLQDKQYNFIASYYGGSEISLRFSENITELNDEYKKILIQNKIKIINFCLLVENEKELENIKSGVAEIKFFPPIPISFEMAELFEGDIFSKKQIWEFEVKNKDNSYSIDIKHSSLGNFISISKNQIEKYGSLPDKVKKVKIQNPIFFLLNFVPNKINSTFVDCISKIENQSSKSVYSKTRNLNEIKEKIVNFYKLEKDKLTYNVGGEIKLLKIEKFVNSFNKFSNNESEFKIASLSNEKITFKKEKSNSQYDFENLSDGEKQILSFGIEFLNQIENGSSKSNSNSFIFIDEIGVYMHPRWQYKILNFIKDIYKDEITQAFITTHSTIIPYSINQETDILINLSDENETIAFQNYSSIDDFVNRSLEIKMKNQSDEADVWVEGRSDKLILEVAKTATKKILPFNFLFSNTIKENKNDGNTENEYFKEIFKELNNRLNGAPGIETKFWEFVLKNEINNHKKTFLILDKDLGEKKYGGSAIFEKIKKILTNESSKEKLKSAILYDIKNSDNEIWNLQVFDALKIIKSNPSDEREIIFLLIYKQKNSDQKVNSGQEVNSDQEVNIETFIQKFEDNYGIKFKDKSKYSEVIKEIKAKKLEKEFANCFTEYFADLKTLYDQE